MTAVVISQPMLFPWPGFFEQLMLADKYIYLDDTQFSKGSFTNRVQVLSGDDRSWMTIPLAGKGTFQKISEIQGAGDGWKTDHRERLQRSLAGSQYLDEALSIVDDVYASSTILELLLASIELTARYIGIGHDRIVSRSSEMNVPGTKSQRVLDLVLAVGGTRYLTGHGAAQYLDHLAFEEAGVSIEYMQYSCTPWFQQRPEFTPYVSTLDLIARVGPSSLDYLKPTTVSWRDFVNAQAER